jgi:hypothetical protein
MDYDQRVIVCFLHNEHVEPDQICTRLKAQFENDTYSLRRVQGWYQSVPYYLVDKHVHQPCLMKLNMTNIDEKHLSSDVVFIALAYFLNPRHPSLK